MKMPQIIFKTMGLRWVSINETNLQTFAKVSSNTSRHCRSICWLYALLPASTEPHPVPRVLNMYLTTSTFSNPWSHLILDGNPQFATAFMKSEYTVIGLLFDNKQEGLNWTHLHSCGQQSATSQVYDYHQNARDQEAFLHYKRITLLPCSVVLQLQEGQP